MLKIDNFCDDSEHRPAHQLECSVRCLILAAITGPRSHAKATLASCQMNGQEISNQFPKSCYWFSVSSLLSESLCNKLLISEFRAHYTAGLGVMEQHDVL